MNTIIQEHKWLIIKGGIAAGGCLIFLLLHLQILFGAFEIMQSTESLQASVREANSWAEITKGLKVRNAQLSEHLQEISDTLPEQKVQSGIIAAFNETAEKNHLQFKYLKPVELKNSDAFREETFELMLAGSFHNVAKFINALEQSENIICLRALELATEDLTSNTIRARIKLSVLQINGI